MARQQERYDTGCRHVILNTIVIEFDKQVETYKHNKIPNNYDSLHIAVFFLNWETRMFV